MSPKLSQAEAKKHAADFDEAEAKREAHRKKEADRIAAHQSTLARLRELGDGLHFPTNLRPHLVCAKRKKDENPIAEHGVTFRRAGADCLVEAGNRIACVSILLDGQGEDGPHLAVVPAEAMEIIAGAEDELATLWFADCKVHILVDQAVHEFFVLQPDLPMFEQLRDTDARQRMVAGVALDATQLVRIQKALGTEMVALRHHSKNVLSVYPDGNDKHPNRGYLALFVGEEG